MSNIRDRGPRDYRQEEQRRNELARERGFTSRAQLRNRVAGGTAEGRPAKAPPFERAGFASPGEYRRARKTAAKWSAQHSRVEVSRYDSAKLRDPSRFRAYYDAYARDGDGRAKRDWLKYYLVDVEDYVSDEEFEREY